MRESFLSKVLTYKTIWNLSALKKILNRGRMSIRLGYVEVFVVGPKIDKPISVYHLFFKIWIC